MMPQQTTYLSPERKCCSRETIQMSVSTYLAKCSVKRPKQMKDEGTPQSRRPMIDQDSIRFRSAFTVNSTNSEKKLNWTKIDDNEKLTVQLEGFITQRGQKKSCVEHLLVKYHSIFAKLCLDISINTQLEVKLTPRHDQPVYSASLYSQTFLKDHLLIELALMQKYGILAILLVNK